MDWHGCPCQSFYSAVTVTVYTVSGAPPETVIVSSFSPSAHVAELPFSISVVPSMILTVAFGSVGVAVTLFVALLVVAVYSTTELLNSGSSVNDPIVSPERVVRFLPLQCRLQWQLPDLRRSAQRHGTYDRSWLRQPDRQQPLSSPWYP